MKKYRKYFGLCLALLCLFLQTLLAFAEVLTDDCGDTQNTSTKKYKNMTVMSSDFVAESGWLGAPYRKNIALAASSAGEGSAIYRVNGVETISVAIYTQKGSFASRKASDPYYTLGYKLSAMNTTDRQRLMYHAGSDTVYLPMGNIRYSLIYDKYSRLLFSKEYTGEDGDRNYGLNIYVSDDGEQFTRIPTTSDTVLCGQNSMQNIYYCETFSATIPSSATYIKVGLTDYRGLYHESTGSMVNMGQIGSMRLANVTMEGKNAAWHKDSGGSSSSASSSEGSSSSKPGDDIIYDPNGGPDKGSSSSKYVVDPDGGSLSWFYQESIMWGVMTGENKDSGKSSSKAASGKWRPSEVEKEESAQAPSESAVEFIYDETQVLASGVGNQGGQMEKTWMIAGGVYLGLAALLITGLLLRRFKARQ